MNYLSDIDYMAPEFAEFYDELPIWSARFGLLLLDQVPLRPGMAILDVGAGTGFLSIELAQRCGETTQVFAIDPWSAAMERLQRKCGYLKISSITTITQDAARLNLSDASIDLIVSNLGINNFDNPDAVLRQCHRVARPGARLFMTTNLVGHMGEFYDVFRQLLMDHGHKDRLDLLDQHIGHRATVDSVRNLLERCGFEFVRAEVSSFRERFADGSALLRHFFIRLGFLPAWKAIAPQDAIETTFLEVEKRLNMAAEKQGELALTIPIALIEAKKAAR